MANLLTKVMVTGAVAGMVGFGTLAFTGEEDINSIRDLYNRVHTNYETALNNITIYKNELSRRAELIAGAEQKQEALQSKIDELNSYIEGLEGGSEEDAIRIAELEVQVEELQAQLDAAATDEELNLLTAEITRLQGELNIANEQIAALQDEIEMKDAQLTDIQAVTAEDVQNGVDIANLYYTFEATSGSRSDTATLAQVLTDMQIVDELNESPVAITSYSNYYQMGNLNAFRKIYDRVNGAGAFETAYNTKLAEGKNYSTIMSSMSFKVEVNGSEVSVYFNILVPLTPNGATVGWDNWFNEDSTLK